MVGGGGGSGSVVVGGGGGSGSVVVVVVVGGGGGTSIVVVVVDVVVGAGLVVVVVVVTTDLPVLGIGTSGGRVNVVDPTPGCESPDPVTTVVDDEPESDGVEGASKPPDDPDTVEGFSESPGTKLGSSDESTSVDVGWAESAATVSMSVPG